MHADAMTDGLDLARLAREVRSRRAELGLAQGDLSALGGPSIVTVGQIERGQITRPQASTLRRLDKALGWGDGRASRLLTGETDEAPTMTRTVAADVIAAIRADPDLLDEAKQHLVNQYGLLLRLSTTPPPTQTREEVDRELAAELSVHEASTKDAQTVAPEP